MSYRGVTGWRAGAATAAPLPGGGEAAAAAALQAATAATDGLLRGAAWQPVAGAGAATAGTVGVGRIDAPAAVGLPQAAAAAA